MTDIIGFTIALVALAVSVYGYYRSRYWARKSADVVDVASGYAAKSAASAVVARSYAGAAQDAADRASLDQ
jgi:hypothetical protein